MATYCRYCLGFSLMMAFACRLLACFVSGPNLLRPSGTRPLAAHAGWLAVFLAHQTFCEVGHKAELRLAWIDVAGLAFCSFHLLPPPGQAGRKAMNLLASLRGSFQLRFRRREASGNLS